MEASLRRWATLVAFGLLAALPQVVSVAEPCNLLTVQEIAQVLGNPVSSMPIGTTGCIWNGSPQGVNITLRNASAWPRITAQGPGITKTDVSGIGDAASFSGMQNMWTLSVKQGNNVIVLTVTGAKTPDQQRSSEESLARLAIKRL
ncbi:MAG: hypothetical protein ABSG62_18405 [Terracidiphilus sp.]|jgi:hypothetical protein